MSRSPELAILQSSEANHRVITAAQITSLGVTDKVKRRLVRDGFLVRVRRGLFRVGEPPGDVGSLASSVVLSLPGSAAYRQTAARLLHVPGPWGGSTEVVIPRGRAHQLPGITVHETRHLPDADLTQVDGVPCTTLERTLIDLVTIASPQRMRWTLEQLHTDDRLSVPRLRSTFVHFARRGRSGTVAARQILDEFLSRDPIPESFLEREFALLCARNDLTGFVRQYRPPWYDGVRGIVDNALPEAKLIVETDGRAWHTISQAIGDDHRRDRTAAAHGWISVRYDFDEVVRRPTEVVDELRQLISIRTRR